MVIKAVLLDHDGTIVDSEFSHYQMWAKVLLPCGASLTETDYRKYYAGMPAMSNAANMIRHFNMQVSESELVESKLRETRAFLTNGPFPTIPGALETMEKFHNHGLKLAIVTGSNQHCLSRTAEAYGLERFVSAFISCEDVVNSKPAPDCYLLAMKKLGVTAQQSVAIEDTEHGIKAAVAAGIRCLAIPTEMSEHHDFSAAEKVFGNILEASEWIIDHAV
ncbi:MAG: HAD family phosphatase [Gammaproteobacteria bacterium]|nr:HAD family phosphatase [Gammaproteobacteria bacterium]